MNKGFYLQTSRIELTHWWFVHRRRLVDAMLRRHLAPGTGARGLDLGCGTGGNLALLRRYCADVVGLDRSEYALEIARKKQVDAHLVLADANRLGERFREESFDLVTVFNVLYHRWIDREDEVLLQIRRVLRPAGLLVLTEPAFRLLFRRHDQLDYGARRYRLREMTELVRGAGLEVRRASYFNLPAFLPALLLALVERGTGRAERPMAEDEGVSEMRLPAPALNRAILAALAPERLWIGKGARAPFGVSLVVLAEK